MPDLVVLLVSILAVWRLTYLLAYEEGPFQLFQRIRRCLIKWRLGAALSCFYCLSLWIALPVTGFTISSANTSYSSFFLLWLAYSGGAILLERLTQPTSSTPPQTIRLPFPTRPQSPNTTPSSPIYWEEQEPSS
jgi:Protein of unknown function (DUF1360)